MRLKTKLLLVLVAILVAALAVNVAIAAATQRRQMEEDLLERGQVISMQMIQTWNFLAENRGHGDGSAGDARGTSDAGGAQAASGELEEMNCAQIGRSIGETFTDESGYLTRFVSLTPRNPDDEPDAFEADALRAFADDAGLEEVFEATELDGRRVFRYVAPMRLAQPCLDCHGSPAGEIDATGYAKEGKELGDVGGATSVVVPMEGYLRAEAAGIARNAAVSAVVLILVLAAVYAALTKLVTRPLAQLQRAVADVRSGNLGVSVPQQGSSVEMDALAAEFNRMTCELTEVYAGLESQVEERTALLVAANERLEAQGRELQAANARLVEENRYKGEFLAMMSHELRTPLTSILAFSQMLGTRDDLGEREATACREIEAQSRALLLTINDVLEMSRLDAGRAQLCREAVDLGDLLGFVESVVAPVARKQGVALDWDVAADVPVVFADFDKLAHVLENLLFNAVKFTPAGGRVDVRAVLEAPGDAVRIAVADTGIGIAPQDQERIFDTFVQVDSSQSRAFNGTGLGLPLARRYVQMHDGAITVRSALGAGSVFTVVLPLVGTDERGGLDG